MLGARAPGEGPLLYEGWVIANHILVSFHVAFISSVLALPSAAIHKAEVLRFIFLSPETLVSAFFVLVCFHTAIAVHEIGHFRTAVRLNALNPTVLEEVSARLRAPFRTRVLFYLDLFVRTPWGKARGIKREGLNYYPDAPYNLAVAAAGPRASRNLAIAALVPAGVLLSLGLGLDWTGSVYAGRLLLGIGVVGLLDFLMADPGKYREFRERERRAGEQAASVKATGMGQGSWYDQAPAVKQRMLAGRIQEMTHRRLGPVTAPWQFRNCGMGGRHTEKEYPESNISMQEAMFLILGARDYQEAQEMTVRLQTRLKEIIEKAEGGRVMGIGLEGGLAPYIEKGEYPLPEIRLWLMMKQTIEECGFRPGRDVAIALDPAMSELENAYRDEFNMPDAVGMYLFWRDKAKTVLDRDAVLDVYRRALIEYEIPIISIEDGFSENDREGWRMLLESLGDRIFVIGDDLVTTNDRTIEQDAGRGLINTALIKANQIGSLYETLIAMLVAMGKDLEIVVSHRSKSPNDDMEAHIALAVNSLGMKAGGGANTERLVKYQAVAELMGEGQEGRASRSLAEGRRAVVDRLVAYEEPTNAGIPTVGATAEIVVPEAGVTLRFRGATPLGTSAGTGEAIHLVDSSIEAAENRELIERHGSFFSESEPRVFRFRPEVKEKDVRATADEALQALFVRAKRYGGKGCINAAENVVAIVAPAFVGRSAPAMTLLDIDRTLLRLEERVARRRGKLGEQADLEDRIGVMQRKQNLGMNAILAVSLALARGLAHLKGQHLYEMLRDEMMRLIARLCQREEVPIAGSRLADYVEALRLVNGKLESRGKPLYQALRETSRIYEEEALHEPDEVPSIPAESPSPPVVAPASPVAADAGSGPATGPYPAVLSEDETVAIADLGRLLHRAFVSHPDTASRSAAIRRYLEIKPGLGIRHQAFGFINNRLFRIGDRLAIPYIVGDQILVQAVADSRVDELGRSRLRRGTLITDELVLEIGGIADHEIVDLEPVMFDFAEDDLEIPLVSRVRDIAGALGRINESLNRTFAVFALRCLTIRLIRLSFRDFLSAKNMQPEVRNLNVELDRFLNGSIRRRVPLLVRILVRTISGLATKPTVIDRLWTDTIDLAEVHVRGSTIVNELRRRTHHALGMGTLRLARAYLAYLETGDVSGLVEEGQPAPAAADQEARQRPTPIERVRRIVDDLAACLGTGDALGRLQEWRKSYSDELFRCDFGEPLAEEADLMAEALRSKNRYVFSHHLRIVKAKTESFSPGLPGIAECLRDLRELLEIDPADPATDVSGAERTVRGTIQRLESLIRSSFQEDLFAELDRLTAASRAGEPLDVADRVRKMRRDLWSRPVGFPQQRRHLVHLDCLLEEVSYLALRQLASRYEDEGVDLRQCLRTIRSCVENLESDGVPSRELRDLADILLDESRTFAEVLDVLESLTRCFHRMLQRVTTPFEEVRERLGMAPDEFQLVLGNLKRSLFDLNCMVQFAELASRHVRDNVEDIFRRVDGGGAAECPDGGAPFDFLHISHQDEIRRRVESSDSKDCLRNRYGGKGSSLLYISYLNLPTRDGFIIPTLLPRSGLHERRHPELENAVAEHLAILERDIAARDGTPLHFGVPDRPLLLAVRGGSVLSLPGTLATIVFTGMNDPIAGALAEDDPWNAYDSYRRFLASFALAVWNVDLEAYDLVDETKRRYGVRSKDELPWEGMREVVEASKAVLRQRGLGRQLDAMLEDPRRQLMAAIDAVLASWERETARRYRDIKRISHGWHTAVIVQAMAFGNRTNQPIGPGMNERACSLTGVIPHTRVSSRGVRELQGEFKFSAAGDDLVAGVTSPGSFYPIAELESFMPMLHRRLRHVVARLRRFHGTDQDIEFTVDEGILSILQSRTSEKVVDEELVAFQEPGPADTHGIGVRGGAFRGVVAFDEADRVDLVESGAAQQDGVDGILMMMENPTPDDIPSILTADGLLAAKGGSTSHAAVAINGLENKPLRAVMGATGLRVDAHRHEAVIEDATGNVIHRIGKGDVVSIHGTTGQVFLGSRPVIRPGSRRPVPEHEHGSATSSGLLADSAG